MRKFASRILILSLIFTASILGFFACGDPYKDLKMTISSPEVTVNKQLGRNEFVLTASSTTITVEAKITGGDASVDKRVDISLEQPTEVLEHYGEVDTTASDRGITTAKFSAKNGGYATIKCVSKEGGLIQTFKVYVVIPIESVVFSNDVVPIVKGQTTDIANSLANENTLFDYINFTPSNTNQKDSLEFVFEDEEPQGVSIQGTKITVANSCNVSSFNLKARYVDLNGDTKETQPIIFKILTPFNVTKVKAFNQNEGYENEVFRDEQNQYLYHLKLSTNLNIDYSNSYQAFLAFKFEGIAGSGQYDRNMLNPRDYISTESFSYGTEYSITCETEMKSSTVSSFSQVLDVKRTNNYNFNIVHKNYAITEDIKFYVNYKGYEEFFKDTVLTVRVEVMAFPEEIVVAESEEEFDAGSYIEENNHISVYKEYSSALKGTPLYVAVLGPDSKELNMEKFTAKILDDDGKLELLVKRGASYIAIDNKTELQSGTELFLRIRPDAGEITSTQARIVFSAVLNGNTGNKPVENEIIVDIITEAVRWNELDGNGSAEIFMNFTEANKYNLVFADFVAPTWLDIDGGKKPTYQALQVGDFKVSGGDEEIAYAKENINENLNSIEIFNARNKLGTTNITITTPNGFILSIKVTVVINLTEENLVLSFNNHVDKIEITPVDSELQSFTALVGDKQIFDISYVNKEAGFKYKLGYNNGYISYQSESKNPKSVRIENGNEIVALTASTIEKQPLISITIGGYSWEGDESVSTVAPKIKDFKFQFRVLVLEPVSSIGLENQKPAIFTSETLNHYKDEAIPNSLSDFESKGKTTISLSVNPSTVTTNTNIYWKLYRDLDGGLLADNTDLLIGKDNRSGLINYNSGGLYIFYELSEDLTRLTLYAELMNDSERNQVKSINVYAYAYVDESYSDFYGEIYRKPHSRQTRVSISNAVLVNQIIPEVAFNTIKFDKREMIVDEEASTETRVYFDQTDPNTCFEFDYKLNPINPENKRIIASVSDASIRAEIDWETQKVKVYVVSIAKGDIPEFTLYLYSVDSQSRENATNFSCFAVITILVQDGLSVPYEIASEEDLRSLAQNPDAYDYNYILTNDITLKDAWTPIGTKENPFTGSFSGANILEDGTIINHTISGLFIDDNFEEDDEYFGLFAVTKDAELSNIRLSKISLKVNAIGERSNNIGIGSLVGLAINTKISNSYIDDGNGLASINGAKLTEVKLSDYGIEFSTNSQNSLIIVGVGGIAGIAIGGIIENSSSLIKLDYKPANNTSILAYVGGIAGYLTASDKAYLDDEGQNAKDFDGTNFLPNIRFDKDYSSLAYNVVSLINLKGDMLYISSEQPAGFGGVVGFNDGYIQGGKFRSIISGKDNLGGIAGINFGRIESATVSPSIIGSRNIGGAVGANASYMQSYEYNTVSYGLKLVGTFSYDIDSASYISNTIQNHSNIGYIKETKVQFLDYGDNYSYFNTALAGIDAVGGLVGLNIQNSSGGSFATSLSHNSVYSYVAKNRELSKNYSKENTMALFYGDIVLIGYSPNQAVGGLVGSANNLAIFNSYSYVVVNENNVVGENSNPAIIGGALGYILPGGGDIIMRGLNVSGKVAYLKSDGTYSVDAVAVGGFIGDASNIRERLTFTAQTFNYSGTSNFLVEGILYPFYNIQNSYTLFSFHNGVGGATYYIENFAGRNEYISKPLTYTDRYTIRLSYNNSSDPRAFIESFVGEWDTAINGSVSGYFNDDAIWQELNGLGLILDGSIAHFDSYSDIGNKLKYRAKIERFDTVSGQQYISYLYYSEWSKIPGFITDGKVGTQTSYSPVEVVESSTKTYQVPRVLTSNSYYIGFSAYLKNKEGFVSGGKITITDLRAKGDTFDTDAYRKNTAGAFVLYIDKNGTAVWTLFDNCTPCNILGESGTGYYKLPSGMVLSETEIASRRYEKTNLTKLDIYNSGFFFDNINNSPVTAGIFAINDGWKLLEVEKINSFTGWDETVGKPEKLEDYNSYINEGVNGGFPIGLSKNKENDGKVEFLVDLPPESISISYNYENINAFESERETIESVVVDDDFGVVSNIIKVEKVESYTTLNYYKVDTTALPELFGYYDFNGDGNIVVTQNEKIYTSHVKAIVREKNRYPLNDIINIEAVPAYLNISDLTVVSSSSLVEVEYSADGIYIILLGSGKAEIEIFSNLNKNIYNKVYLNIINKVSGIELFKDSVLEDPVTESSLFKIVKGYDKKLYIKTEEYLDGLNVGLTNLYGKIRLAKNSVFNIGVRYYLVAETEEGLNVYHAEKDIPAGFTINGLPYKVLETEEGYLIYVDVDSINYVSFYGIEKSKYKIMAVPYVYEKADGDKTLLYKGEISHESGKIFGIEVLDGTFGISSSIDSNTDPFKPINFESTITTDNPNANAYLAIEKVGADSSSYMEIKGLEKVSTFEAVSSISSFRDLNGNVITIQNLNIYKLPIEAQSFEFDKFRVKITGIGYYDENNQKVEVKLEENAATGQMEVVAEEEIKYIKYTYQISVLEDYLYHIGDIENFKFKFYTVKTAEITNEQVIETEFNYNITPQEVENVELYHYADIQLQTVDISTGQQTIITEVNQDFVSDTLVCGEPGLLHINVHPGYSDVEYVEITSTVSKGYYVSLEQMYANCILNTDEGISDKFIFNGTYSALPIMEDISINDGLGIKLSPNSFAYLEDGETKFDYNGNFYIKTAIPTLYDPEVKFELIIEGFANGEKVFSETQKIIPQLKPSLEFHSDNRTEIPVAIGTSIEITLRSDGVIEESSKFWIYSSEEEYQEENQEKLIERYIEALKQKSGTTDKYVLTLPFNEQIIGKVFYLEVTAYKDVNNNRYETVKQIAIKPALFVVEDIAVEGVEYNEDGSAYLKGNYNQDYALKVDINANYCLDTNMINTALNAGQNEDKATPKIESIQREVEKLEARISSLGLYGEYKSLSDTDEKDSYKLDQSIVMEWQAEANKFGETQREYSEIKDIKILEREMKDEDGNYKFADSDYINYSTKSWYVVNGDVEETVSVWGDYRGIAIDNGRAEYLLTDRFIGEEDANGTKTGYYLREPYATLNVRVTDINTATILKFQTEIDYDLAFGETGVGIKLTADESGFASHFETEFGFKALQLANEENPEPIYTTEEFKEKMLSGGGHYILMEDIELELWDPIQTEVDSFDGNGYVIRLKSFNEIAGGEDQSIGIFSSVSEKTVLKNLIIEIPPSNRVFDETKELTSSTEGDLTVRVDNLSGVKFGVVAGTNEGTITNAIVINNADSYREERDVLLSQNGSNGKITETELEERRKKYYSTYISENILALDSNRTSSIISVVPIEIAGNKENTDSSDIRIAGFVGLNSGYITNSAVENISIISSYYVAGFVCENDGNGRIASSYFKGGNVVNVNIGESANYTTNGTAGFTVINNGEINYSYVYGREIGLETNISGINETTIDGSADKTDGDSDLYIDRYVGLRYTYSGITTGRDSKLNEYLKASKEDPIKTLFNMRALGTIVKSVGTATGFVYNNSGKITNSYSNIFVMADASSGFVYINGEEASIKNSFTLSSVQNKDTDHTAFSGVTYESNSPVDLGKGAIENCYYLKVTADDYQELYEIYSHLDGEDDKEKALIDHLISKGPFLGETDDDAGLSSIVNSEERWVDEFYTPTTEKALPLSAVEFASYTSFVSFSFNNDYSLNGEFDADVEGSGPENLARAVWFIPEAEDNDAIENLAISNYFKHSNYVARVPQLVSANLKTMSLRYSNFIRPLETTKGMDDILSTLKEKMGYARIATVQKGIANGYLKDSWDILQAILIQEDDDNPYAVGYAKELGEAIIEAYIEIKNVSQDLWPIISGTNTIENQINVYFSDSGINSIKDKLVNDEAKDILLLAVNKMNAITEDSEATYSYSFVQSNMKGVDINYGKTVLNPYLVSSAEKFNVYTLQINSLGEITETEQGAALRLIKDIAFDNIIQTAQTYKATFFGDFEGNGLTVQDLSIVAEKDESLKEAIKNGIQNLGLFGEITKNEVSGKKANIRNLNIDIEEISATAVRFVGGLAGQITGGEVHNINITGDEESSIQGFNATGGLAGRISGDETLVSNVYNSVSVKSHYYSTPYNIYSASTDDTEHRFNLYVEPELLKDEDNNVAKDKEGNPIYAVQDNIKQVSYAGGIAGMLEAKSISAINGEESTINANIRSNTVSGDITIRGEVVGGLFGYLGKMAKISNSKLIATTGLRLNASAVAGGLVGDLRGEITTSHVENENQEKLDNVIYNTVYSTANSMNSTIGLDYIMEDEAKEMFAGNAHYIGGIAGISYRARIDYSYNRVDVANINSKYAGGIIGLSIGITMSNVYTTSSVNSFVAYGGLIGIQTLDNHKKVLLRASSQNDYYISNWSQISAGPDSTPIAMSAVVGANLWKDAHKNTNRSGYRIDAMRAQLGSFIGRAVAYNETSAYEYYGSDADFNAHIWYSEASNTLTKRVKNESVFFMMDYTASADKKIISEIGNATSIKVNFNEEQKALVENTSKDADLPYVVRNSTAYIAFENSTTIPTAYAYSGDFSSKIQVKGLEGDENYKYYRFSRLQNYGSLRTIKEFIQGVYLESETAISGLTARIYDANFRRFDEEGNPIADALNHNYIETNTTNSGRNGELALNSILIDDDNKETKEVDPIIKALATTISDPVNSQPQTIYNNWASDAWLGVEMDVSNYGFGERQNKLSYVFPEHRTKVFEDVIYVRTPWDLINNTENHPDSTYIILNDINLDEVKDGWAPLNSETNPFTGVLKSYGGYVLRGFTSDDVKKNENFTDFGLFAYVKDAEFNNFGIQINKLNIDSADTFGILAGQAKDCKFEEITITTGYNATISTSAKYVGGLVGKITTEKITTSKILNSVVNIGAAFVVKNSEVHFGLITGFGNNMQIANVTTAGIMNPTANISNSNIGGMVGDSYEILQIYNGVSRATITLSGSATSSNIGGLVGRAEIISPMELSGSDGNIYAAATNSNIGGLVGFLESMNVKAETVFRFSVSNTNIYVEHGSSNNIGGIVSKIKTRFNVSIENSYSTGNIGIPNASQTVGGIAGLIEAENMSDVSIVSVYSMNKISKNVNCEENGTIGGVVGSYTIGGTKASNLGITLGNALYVYDFMPVNNGYGVAKTSYQFRTLSIAELGLSTANLEEAGVIPKQEKEEGEPDDPDKEKPEIPALWQAGGLDEGDSVLYYPILNIEVLMVGPLQQRGNNQAVAVINSANDNIVKTADAVYYTGSELKGFESIDTTTLYLNSEIEQTGTTLTIGSLGAVFGLNTEIPVLNHGTISQANLSNLANANGYLVQSYVYSEDLSNSHTAKTTWFNSYIFYNGDSKAIYYNSKSSLLKAEEFTEIRNFKDANFDFDNMWTVYHIKDSEDNILLGYSPVLRWQITDADYHGGDQSQNIENFERVQTYTIVSDVNKSAVEKYVDFVKAYNAGKCVSNIKVELGEDLDFTGKILTPLGTKDKPFEGEIDGNAYGMKGILISGTDSVGLIGYAKNARILNLYIDCLENEKTGVVFGTSGSAVGSIVGTNIEGSVLQIGNVQIQTLQTNSIDRFEVVGDIAGGFVGKSYGQVVIQHSTYQGYVYGNSIVGGFIGEYSNLSQAFQLKETYISNGRASDPTETNIFGTGNKGLIAGKIVGRESTTAVYQINEVYISTCKDSGIRYFGLAQNRIAVAVKGLAGYDSSENMANVVYYPKENFTQVLNENQFREDYFPGFSWGKVWTRLIGLNNNYPTFFSFWEQAAKIPDRNLLQNGSQISLPGEGQVASGTIKDFEEEYANALIENNIKIIEIDEAGELAWISRAVNHGLALFDGITIKLTANIDLQTKGWTPIGYYEVDAIGGITDRPFKGNFDGNNKRISNLKSTIATYSEEYSGLFGYVSGSEIKDFIIGSGDVVGKSYLGSAIGLAKNSTISGISSGALIKILPNEENPITRIYIGGIVGYAENSSISGCEYVFNSPITIKKEEYTALEELYIGGIVGYLNGGNELDNLTVSAGKSKIITVSIDADTCYIGGIAGRVIGIAGLEDLHTAFTASADPHIVVAASGGAIGGVIGSYEVGATLENIVSVLSNNANLSSGLIQGGIFGRVQVQADKISYINITNEGNSSTNHRDYSGGVAGYMEIAGGKTLFENLVNKGVISGNSFTAGIVGNLQISGTLSIKNCSNLNTINGKDFGVGGIIGQIAGTISEIEILGTINSGNILTPIPEPEQNQQGTICVGGIAGKIVLQTVNKFRIGSEALPVENTGSVRGSHLTAGIIGFANISASSNAEIVLESITNSGAITYIKDSSNIAGIIGDLTIANGSENSGISLNILNCINKGLISPTAANTSNLEHIGGLFGVINANYKSNSEINLSNLKNSAEVLAEAAEYVGGIAGKLTAMAKVIAMDLNNSSKIVGKFYVAGLIGSVESSVGIDLSSNFVQSDETKHETIYTTNFEDEIIDDYTIIYGYRTLNSGEIRGSQSVGGFFGSIKHGNIFGKQAGNKVYMLVNSGKVSATGDETSYVGGIVGQFNIESYNTYTDSAQSGYSGINTLKYLENRGKVEGNNYVGGIAGYAIADSYILNNIGNLSAGSYAGGIMGQMLGRMDIARNSGIFERATSYAGGIVGRFELAKSGSQPTAFSKLTNFQSVNSQLVPNSSNQRGSLVGSMTLQGSSLSTTNKYNKNGIWLGLDGMRNEFVDEITGERFEEIIGDYLVIGNAKYKEWVIQLPSGFDNTDNIEIIPITCFKTFNGGAYPETRKLYSNSPQWTMYYGGYRDNMSVILADVSQIG